MTTSDPIPDVASVKEALAVWDDPVATNYRTITPRAILAVSTLRAAARAWVDQMERGETVWWCEKHRLFGTDMECDENGMGQRACSMVPSLRVPLVSPSPTNGDE